MTQEPGTDGSRAPRPSFFLILWVPLLSFQLLLLVPAFLQQTPLSVILLLVFAGMGLVTLAWPFAGFLVFVFLFPILPAKPEQFGLPAFSYHEFLFLSLSFWWTVLQLRKGSASFRCTSLNSLVGLFLLVAGLSCWLSLLRDHILLSNVFLMKLTDRWNVFVPWDQMDEMFQLRALLNWLEGACLFFISVQFLSDQKRIEKTIATVLFAALVVSVLGIFQYVFRFRLLEFWVRMNPHIARINASWSDPNALGAYLGVAAAMIGAMLFLSTERRKLRFISLLIVSVALLFTASRAALFAVITALGTAAVYFLWRRREWAPGRIRSLRLLLLLSGLLLGSIVCVAAWIDYRNPQPGNLGELILFSMNPRLPPSMILEGRFFLWQAAIDLFRSRPWTGWGIGKFMPALAVYRSQHPSAIPYLENAHNYYLQLLVELGGIGFLLFSLLLYATGKRSLSFLREAPTSDTPLILASICGLLVILLTSITGHPLLLLQAQFLFWILLAVCWAFLSSSETVSSRVFRKPRSVFYLKIAAAVIVAVFLLSAWSVIKERNVLPYEAGFFEKEQSSTGEIFRWTGHKAFSILPVQGRVLRIKLRQENPDVTKHPLYTQINLDGNVEVVRFQDSNWRELCYYMQDPDRKTVSLAIENSEVFVPQQKGTDNDLRALGVAVALFKWECCLTQPAGVRVKTSSPETLGECSH